VGQGPGHLCRRVLAPLALIPHRRGEALDMVLEFKQPASIPPPSPEPPAPRTKVRVRFRKGGPLRLVSHHDLMHVFERMLRRADLPLLTTQGFNPRPRMLFPLSLALGIVGCREVVELELARAFTSEEIHQRLAGQAPPGLEILSVQAIEGKLRGQVRRAGYRLEVPAERRQTLPERIAALLALTHAWIERTRPQPRQIDVRPYLSELRLAGDFLEITLWVTPYGTARPEEVLELLGLEDLPENGTIVERILLELHDEVSGEGTAAVPPLECRREPAPAEQDGAAGKRPKERTDEAAPRPTSLMAGPMSFDS
jgi:radical SAM-linked protein